MSDTVIRVENISKLYRLGEVGTGFHPELTGREPKGLPPVRTKSISIGKFTT
jgi:hypothetical protein